MPWSGSGSFSRTNSVHTGATTWEQDRVNGDKIIATRHDTHDQDLSDGIQACIAKNGENSPSADLPMATYKHTNVGAAAARTDYARASQVQDCAFLWGGTSGGSSSAYTIALTPAITAYAQGQRFVFVANHSNTGATTIAVNGLAAAGITDPAGTALAAGMINSGAVVEIVYSGTKFCLMSETIGSSSQAAAQTRLGLAPASSPTFTALTLSGLTASKYVVTDGSKVLASQTGVPLADVTYANLTWTPAVTANGGATIGTVATEVARYQTIGSWVHFALDCSFTITGTPSELYVTTPGIVTLESTTQEWPMTLINDATRMGIWRAYAASPGQIIVMKQNGGGNLVAAATRLCIQGTYLKG